MTITTILFGLVYLTICYLLIYKQAELLQRLMIKYTLGWKNSYFYATLTLAVLSTLVTGVLLAEYGLPLIAEGGYFFYIEHYLPNPSPLEP